MANDTEYDPGSLTAIDEAHKAGPDSYATVGRARPISVLAVIGGAILAINFVVIIRWVFSDRFARVSPGPDAPPTWMAYAMNVVQVAYPILAAILVYALVIRPWRRERKVPFDGLLCLAAPLATIWDPVSNAFQPWYAYNSYFVNQGNPLSSLPGWLTYNAPGHDIAWPILMVPFGYMVVFPLEAWLGCAMIRAIRRRLPRLSMAGVALMLVAVSVPFVLFLEGLVILPLGFYSYAGGWWPIMWEGHHFMVPFNEVLHLSIFFAALGLLRYVVNDRGETLPERGLSSLAGGPLKKVTYRFLAVTAALHIALFSLYHFPSMLWALNSQEWPKDTTDRSYFQNTCGPLLDRACPAPDVPASRPDSGYLNWDHQWVPAPNSGP